MPRVAFKMKLRAGCAEEYQRRHDELWPDLKKLLKDNGISSYSIFLDAESNDLFGVLNIGDEKGLNSLPEHPVMKKWWSYMKDIMETNPDDSPTAVPLKEVFFLS